MRAKQKLLFEVLFAVLALPALLGCIPGAAGNVNWPKVLACAPDSARDELLATVSRVLLQDGTVAQMTDRAKTELDGLAQKHGANMVGCVVQELISEWTRPGASPNGTRMAAVDRARGFLSGHGVQLDGGSS